MLADIYLCNASFHSAISYVSQLEDRMCEFSEVVTHIKNHGDCIYRNDSIFEVELIEGFFIYDLYNFQNDKLPRDTRAYLKKIVEYSTHKKIDEQAIIDLLQNNNSALINGLLCLNKLSMETNGNIKHNVIYDKNDWLSFHRHYLSIFPIDSENFYDECVKYFPDLHLHPRIKGTLNSMSDPFTHFSKNIIYCLTHLNDNFKKYYNSANVQNSIQVFSSTIKFEASLEGNSRRKDDFTFSTLDDLGRPIDICCDPHIKIHQSDNYPSDSEYYFYRIYFHGGKSEVAKGKVFVGHIGNHL